MENTAIRLPTIEENVKWTAMCESLSRSQSLAVAGQFAATVMHEINNPLEAITNLNYLLLQGADNADLVSQYSKQIDEQLTILTRIARQTLSFYRPAAEKACVAAVTLAEAALRIHRKNIAAKRIRLQIRFSGDVAIEVHPGEMLQVMSNLISNAVDALPVEGVLYLRGRRCNGGVHILVADAGSGIPASIADKIFDPFFTTKEDKGTGLGLAISKAIVEKHQGRIRTKSSTRPGRSGTTFRISLPLPRQDAAG